MKRVFVAALLLLPSLAFAQSSNPGPSFEVTPFVGYMGGGSINVVGPDIVRESGSTHVDIVYRQRNVKIEQGSTWGIKFNKALSWGPNLQLEGLLERSQSQLEDNQQLFGEAPGGPVPAGDFSYTDMSTTYVQGGVLWLIGRGTTAPYDIRPYVAGSVGIMQIRFHQIPLSDSTRPSISAAVGVKWSLTQSLLLRLESRAYYTNMSKKSHTVPLDVRDCPNCERTYSYPGSELQGDITAGLGWRF